MGICPQLPALPTVGMCPQLPLQSSPYGDNCPFSVAISLRTNCSQKRTVHPYGHTRALYRVQADGLEIEAAAKRRLADEYDAAQERGEVASGSQRTDIVPKQNDVRPATAKDVGLTRKEVHDARQFRDAERAT